VVEKYIGGKKEYLKVMDTFTTMHIVVSIKNGWMNSIKDWKKQGKYIIKLLWISVKRNEI
jgi:hypothetical protein